MQTISREIRDRLEKLLSDGEINRAAAWKSGEFFYDQTPAVFENTQQLKDMTYDSFCGSNLSKYLIAESKKDGKIAALLKPCDTYSFNQLLTEHRIDREKVYVIGVGCKGMIDIDKIKMRGIKGIQSIEENGNELTINTIYGQKKCNKNEVLLEKCYACKGKEHKVYDELIGNDRSEVPECKDRFDWVSHIERMSPGERFEFWQGELSRCIRCNACRNVCPACSCNKCVFDNNDSGISSKSNADSFEEQMFHIIRAFHVAGRCTDCGECSRVCPQKIPLHLLNRKFIKDINEIYGEYQAGEEAGQCSPLTSYTKEDAEPSIVGERDFGGEK